MIRHVLGHTYARGFHRAALTGPRARHFSFNSGTGSQSSQGAGSQNVSGRALTQEEKDLLVTQNKLLQVQLDQVTRQNEALAGIFPDAKDILGQLTKSARNVASVFDQAVTSLGETEGERQFKTASDAQALAIMRGEAPVVSDQEQALINQVFDAQRQQGLRDITQFAGDAASARGLKLTDTPIASEAVRGIKELGQNLGGQQAATTLQVGQQQQQFKEAVRQFQEGLRFQSQQNRLALTGASPFALQAPISTVNPAQASGSVASTFGALLGRPVNSAYTQQGSGNWDQSNFGLNIFGSISTARVKRDIVALDQDEYDKALEKLRGTPITRWNYVWDAKDRHKRIGPILELSPEEIREPDGMHLDMVSYAGMLTAGLKAVDRKVTKLALALEESR